MNKKFKILIAEDNELLLQTIGLYMEMQGYELSLVKDGREAIRQIRENHKIKGSQFDLIVTDVNMPFNNGMEIISIVRNELKLKTPIVVLTTMRVESIELEAFQLGANAFITKPFSPQVLGVRVEKMLSKLSKEVFKAA
jgi:DNA-binding response OmpR family regulator